MIFIDDLNDEKIIEEPNEESNSSSSSESEYENDPETVDEAEKKMRYDQFD